MYCTNVRLPLIGIITDVDSAGCSVSYSLQSFLSVLPMFVSAALYLFLFFFATISGHYKIVIRAASLMTCWLLWQLVTVFIHSRGFIVFCYVLVYCTVTYKYDYND